MQHRIATAIFTGILLAACAPAPHRPDPGHIDTQASSEPGIPAPVQRVPYLESPRLAAPLETYSIVVTDVPARDMLFALARDAKLNVDIHPNVTGNVTLNAIDQTLPQILDRVSRQVNVRFTQYDDILQVQADTPFLRNYKIDYVNMGRNNASDVSVATQIATTGQSAGGAGSSGGGDNNSTTRVLSTSNNQFWASLERNIRSILGETLGADISEGSPAVIVNAESGIISIRATTREHEQLQKFIDQVQISAQRQVFIEATVVEVKLNDDYQLGVDWSVIASGAGWSINQSLLGTNLSTGPFSLLTYADPETDNGSTETTVGMLRKFGDVKVLSSPKIMAINNQAALLKVVDNLVYFTIEAETTTNQSTSNTTFTSTVNTVPVGFVMSVTPQINDTDTVILNIRPTISRVTGFVLDPNPSLSAAKIESSVPQIQVREMDSMLRINSGQTAVLGGLIQDNINLSQAGTPYLSDLPLIGNLFTYRDNRVNKTELVIFLRPRVIHEASIDNELADHQRYLPSRQLITDKPEHLTGGGI